VSQQIVHLASDPVSFRQRCRSISLSVSPDPLGQEFLSLYCPFHVLTSAGPDHQPDDHGDCSFSDKDSRRTQGHGGHYQPADADRSHPQRRQGLEGDPGTEPGDGHEGDGNGSVDRKSAS
jgi:hypothetical protein